MTTETENAPKAPKFKVDKKYIQGFIAGILVAVIAFLAIFAGTPPNFLFGSTGFDNKLVTEYNFQTEVLMSDLPVLAYFWNDWSGNNTRAYISCDNLAGLYEGKIKVARVDANRVEGYCKMYRVTAFPTIVIFDKGKMKAVLVDKNVTIDWIAQKLGIYPNNYTPTPTPTPIQTPAPTPYYGATTYRAFPKSIRANSTALQNEFMISELFLTPWKATVQRFKICDGANMPVNANSALFSLLGDTFGGDLKTFFNIPNFTETVPVSGLNYQICTEGLYPMPDTKISIADTDIRYIPFNGLLLDYYIGQIILASNMNDNQDFVPCDGREMNVNQSPALYSLIANTFGGDGISKFKLPDLSKVTPPVEGAKYYICVNGIYPPRD